MSVIWVLRAEGVNKGPRHYAVVRWKFPDSAPQEKIDMKKKRFSINVDSEQFDECKGMASKMSMSMSAFLRIATTIGCDAIRENPELLLKVSE